MNTATFPSNSAAVPAAKASMDTFEESVWDSYNGLWPGHFHNLNCMTFICGDLLKQKGRRSYLRTLMKM